VTSLPGNPLERLIGEIHRRSLWQVLSIYVVAHYSALWRLVGSCWAAG
jgi:hypothetical protein